MRSLIASVVACLVVAVGLHGQVTLPFYDGFAYPATGNLAGQGSWVAASGSGTITIKDSNLSLPPLQAGGGLAVGLLATGSAARTSLPFAARSSGTVYVAFLLKIDALPSAQRLIAFASSSSSSTTTPPLGFFITTGGQLAVGVKTASPGFVSAPLTVGTTHLIVAGYTFSSGGDTAEIWLDPASLGATPSASAGTTSGSHTSSLAYFLWNTPSASSGGGAYTVDEFRLADTFAAAAPGTGTGDGGGGTGGGTPVDSTGLRVTQMDLNSSTFTLTGKGGPANGFFETLGTGDLLLPLAEWQLDGTGAFDAAGDFTTAVPFTSGLGSRFFVVGVATVPAITTQPQSQTAATGQSITLGVTAGGGAHLSYQWYKNAQVIDGATNATFSITDAQAANAGAYTVVVSNSRGSVTSAGATITISQPPTDGDLYVSPTGEDTNPGTLSLPFKTVQRAIEIATSGDTIYLRGGTYPNSQTITIAKSGTALAPIKLWAYPGETPVLDFSTQPYGAANRGIRLTTDGNYWDFKGLEIMRAGDNAVKVEGSHIRFERCVFHHNGDTGLQIGFAHETSNPGANLAAFIEIINCDSYMNYDSDNRGSDADGFAAKLHCGQGIVFTGCRSWNNSDDGWDLFETDAAVVIRDCWTWHNGDGALFPGSGSFQGNGNGFKLGGNGTGGSSKGVHQLIKGVSFNNKYKSNAQGITNNSHTDGLIVSNCLAFSNGSSAYNYFMEGGGQPMILKNCVSFPRTGSATNVSLDSTVGHQNNSWMLVVSANESDYADLSETAAGAPRKADGSLPDGFARLLTGSDLIDKGVDVGEPYQGTAPDLGPFEF
ncbi:MAG: hypothetical protein RIQ79_1134 [Verrucomicrobiota bacterium]